MGAIRSNLIKMFAFKVFCAKKNDSYPLIILSICLVVRHDLLYMENRYDFKWKKELFKTKKTFFN